MREFWSSVWNDYDDGLGIFLGYVAKWAILLCISFISVCGAVWLFRLMFL